MQIISSPDGGEDWELQLAALARNRGSMYLVPSSPPPSPLPGEVRDALTGAAEALAALGLPVPRRLVLVAPPVPDYSGDMIPDPEGDTIFVPADPADRIRTLVSLAAWTAAAARWRAGWRGWTTLLATRPLRELVYVAGVGRHLAAALVPEITPPQLLDIAPARLRRIEEREHSLRARLIRDLDGPADIGWLRWLAEGTATVARRDGKGVVPLGAGRYLGWRLTAPRVERLGVITALWSEVESISEQ